MKNRQIAIVLLATGVLAGAGFGVYRLGMQQGMSMSAGPASAMGAASTTAGGSNAETDGKKTADGKKVLYWHDPMVPGQKFDKPGKSPFMDMQLVPVYADDNGAGGTAGDAGGQVRISPALQQNLGMRTAIVGSGALTSTIEVVGSVAYDDRDVALVQARSSGFVERLHVRAPLAMVRKGQPLADLYVPEWQAAQGEYLSVKHMSTNQPAALPAGLLDAARGRLRLAGMTEEQIRLVESRGTLQTRFTVFAPIAGVVTELSAREGMTVAAGAPLFRIQGIGNVWLNADVPENATASIRPGDAVEASSPALPGVVFKGKVGALLPDINPQTLTIKTRIEIANPGNRLLPGMFASIRLLPATSGTSGVARATTRGDASSANDASRVTAGRLTVPSEAVIRTGTRTVVMLARDDNSFVPVEVTTGIEANGLTEITRGLTSGQKVVVSGQFLIDSEASLKGIGAPMAEGSALPAPVTSAQPVQPAQPTPQAPQTPQGSHAPQAAPAAPAQMPGSAVPDSSSPVHRGTGKIEKIGPDEITLSHGPIPSLQWGPMTMGFKAPAGMLPKNLSVGDAVSFETRRSKDGMYEIVAIAPQGKPVAPPPPPAPAQAGATQAGAIPAGPAQAGPGLPTAPPANKPHMNPGASK